MCWCYLCLVVEVNKKLLVRRELAFVEGEVIFIHS